MLILGSPVDALTETCRGYSHLEHSPNLTANAQVELNLKPSRQRGGSTAVSPVVPIQDDGSIPMRSFTAD
jgi:hypothetical protein